MMDDIYEKVKQLLLQLLLCDGHVITLVIFAQKLNIATNGAHRKLC